MKAKSNPARRVFLGSALVGAGAAIGGAIRAVVGGRDPAKMARDLPEKERLLYDVSEFERTDPQKLLYHAAGSFETGFNSAKRLSVGPGDRIWVSGDRSVRCFDTTGRVLKVLDFERSPQGLHLSGKDELVVCLGRYFEVHDGDGGLKYRSPVLGENAFVTAVAAHDERLFVADAGAREVAVCDRKNGVVQRRFGRKGEAGGLPGFVVPSPYFDLEIGPDERLHVANPGRLRIERYSLDGKFEDSWGQAGLRIDRFCGCCNPVYFTLGPDGRCFTSEKGLARINVYSASGGFIGAVAGPEHLVEDKELAKRACGDCSVGAGFDVSLTSTGRVVALDPFQKRVRIFEPLTPA